MLAQVLHDHCVGFRITHGNASWSMLKEVADSSRDRPLIALYVGDWDPSGLRMSEDDLPGRLASLSANVTLRRIALLAGDLPGLPDVGLIAKPKDSNRSWFVERTGTDACWELDAMNPRSLRDRVELEIENLIDRDAWDESLAAEEPERVWLNTLLRKWRSRSGSTG